MRKIGILLALLAFILFLFFGLQAAKLIVAPEDGQSGKLPSQETLSQSNILLVHVDRLDSNSPALVSLWMIFSYQAEPASLNFLPVFPTGKDVDSDLAGSFSISNERSISSAFLQQLEKEYQIQWHHVILLDNEGIEYWSKYLTDASFYQLAGSKSDVLLQPEKDLIGKFCADIRENGSQILAGLPWNQIIPDHMSTDLPFDAVFAELDRIQQSGLCEVFGQ